MDKVKLSGRYELRLSDGRKFVGKNLVTTLGKQIAAQRFTGAGLLATHAALGTGTASPAVGQNALIAEIPDSRTAWDGPALLLGSEVSYQVTFFPLTVPWSVREIGIFTAAAGGIMIARFLPPAHNIGVGLSSQLTWLLNFGG